MLWYLKRLRGMWDGNVFPGCPSRTLRWQTNSGERGAPLPRLTSCHFCRHDGFCQLLSLCCFWLFFFCFFCCQKAFCLILFISFPQQSSHMAITQASQCQTNQEKLCVCAWAIAGFAYRWSYFGRNSRAINEASREWVRGRVGVIWYACFKLHVIHTCLDLKSLQD